MRFQLLDKYIISSFLKKLFNILSVFVVIFLIVDIIDHIDRILDYNITLYQISMLYIYSIPQYINIGFPMAMLIATVMTFTVLQKNNELTALKSSGVSIYRLTVPFIIIGILSSISMFYFENMIVTKSFSLKSELEKKYFQKMKKNKLRNHNIVIQLNEKEIISIDKFDHRSKIAKDISIQSFNNNLMISRLDAKDMEWKNESWVANKVLFRSFNNDSIFYAKEDSLLPINLTAIDLIELNTKPSEMNYWALSEFVEKLKNNGKEFKKWLVDLHFKSAFAFSNILMILFGISLSIRKPRSNLLAGVGSSIFIIFIYYLMIKTGQTMGYKGMMTPFLSVWTPNIFFLITGLTLLYKTRT